MKYKNRYQHLLIIYCITFKHLTDKLILMDKLIVWPDESTLFMASCVTDLTVEYGSFWFEVPIDCLHSVSDGMVSVERRQKDLVRTYKFDSAKIMNFHFSEPLTPH